MAMKKFVFGLLILSFVGLTSCVDAALDYSGEWAGTYVSAGAFTSLSIPRVYAAPRTISLSITQSGTTLTGTGTLSAFGPAGATVTGTVTAGDFTMTIALPDFSMDITGIFTSETSAIGTYSTSFEDNGTFSISKQ